MRCSPDHSPKQKLKDAALELKFVQDELFPSINLPELSFHIPFELFFNFIPSQRLKTETMGTSSFFC